MSSDGDGGEKCEDGSHVNTAYLGSILHTDSCVRLGGNCYSHFTNEETET